MKLMETCKAGALRVLVRPLEDAMKIFGVQCFPDLFVLRRGFF
jgi:hypothetical protein